MTTHLLRFFRDSHAPGSTADLSACNRILYVRNGRTRLHAAGQTASLTGNCAWRAQTACRLVNGPEGAELFRWELVRGAQAVAPAAPALLEAALSLDDSIAYLLRCDRVDFPPGGIAYTHTHRGPGIRCLLTGSIRIETGGDVHDIRPGQAWFETGYDPVLAIASKEEPTSFARVMILPADLLGKSSIRYVLPEDQDKPKLQSYQLFVDDAVEI